MELIQEVTYRIAGASQFLIGVALGCLLGWCTSMVTTTHLRERAQRAAAQAATERDTAVKKQAEAEAREALARTEEIRRQRADSDEQARAWRESLESSLRG